MAFRIGYIGLGSLGSAIYPNLQAYSSSNSLPALSVWNRSQDKYADIKAQHPDILTAKEITELVDRCNVIFTCLVDDAAVEDVYLKLVAALKGSKEKVTFVDQSTVKVSTADKIKKLVEETGSKYLTCPVFGQPPAARNRQLICVNSGDAQGREFIKPLLAAIGRYTIDVGEDNGKGAALKLLGNTILLGAIQLYAETYALADAIDFDPMVFHELHQNLFAAPALLNYSNKISKGKYGDAGFTVKTGLKDAGHILSLGEDMGHPLSVPTIVRAKENLLKVQGMGGGDLDWSALAAGVRKDAGLEPFRDGTDQGKGNAA